MSSGRVVSLVPSVTETLLAWGVRPVACTRFCEQPDLPAVGGTKDPDVAGDRAARARPGGDVRRGEPPRGRRRARGRRRRGAQLLAPLGGRRRPGARRARRCGRSSPTRAGAATGARAARTSSLRADLAPAVDVDRRAQTYGSSVLAALGVENVCAGEADRYPEVELDDVRARRPDVVLAPVRALPVPGPAPRRARGGRAGAAGRRPGPVLVGRARHPRPSSASTASSACEADYAGAGRRLDPPALGERSGPRRARRRSPRSRHRSCGRRARRRSPRAARRARRPPAPTPRSRRGGWRGWPPAGRRARRCRPCGARPPCPAPAGSRSARGGPGAAARRRRWTPRRPVGPVAAGRCAPRRPRTRAAGRRTPSRRGCAGTPEWTTTTSTPSGSGTGSIPRSWQSMSSAWPATPAAEVSWSMIPQGTPEACCSARWPSRASARGSGSAPRARATRELEGGARGQPGADGQRRGDAAAQAPGRARPRRRRRPRRPPRRARRAAATRPAPTIAGSGSSSERSSTRSPPAVPTTVVPRSIAIGSTSPPVVSVWSPMRLTRPGANVAISRHRGHHRPRLTAWSSRARMAAMPTAPPNAAGIELFYETFGEPDGEPLLFVMGLGAQAHVWDERAAPGVRRPRLLRHPVRQPRRRAVDQAGGHRRRRGGRRHPLARSAGRPWRRRTSSPTWRPTRSSLLDHLGIESAHIVGASMGGMIVQQMVIDHPERVRSVTSIMSTTGDRDVGQPDPGRVGAAPAAARRQPRRRRSSSSVAAGRAISSPAHFDEDVARAPGRGLLRPLLLPGGRRPPAPRHPRVAVAHRGARLGDACRRS